MRSAAIVWGESDGVAGDYSANHLDVISCCGICRFSFWPRRSVLTVFIGFESEVAA